MLLSRTKALFSALALTLFCTVATAATVPITINFGGSYIQVSSSAVTFSGSGAVGSSALDGPSSASYGPTGISNLLLQPSFTSYSVGPISSNVAPLSGTGSVVIAEASGTGSLSTALNLVDISLSGGNLKINTYFAYNLATPPSSSTAGTYAGFNNLLSALQSGNQAYLTFSLDVPQEGQGSLADALAYFGTRDPVSYNATLYVTPEPAFYGLLSIGMGGLFFFSRRRANRR